MSRVRINSQDFLTVPKMAKTIHRPKMTLYRWIKKGKLIAVEFGGIKFIPVSEIERLGLGKK